MGPVFHSLETPKIGGEFNKNRQKAPEAGCEEKQAPGIPPSKAWFAVHPSKHIILLPFENPWMLCNAQMETGAKLPRQL